MAANNELTREAIQTESEYVYQLTQAGFTIDEVVEHYNALSEAQKSASNLILIYPQWTVKN